MTNAKDASAEIKRIRRGPVAARHAILESTHSLLSGGISLRQLTVDLIVKNVGMRRSSFYHYFANIDQVAVEILASYGGKFAEAGDPWLNLKPGESPLEALRQGLRRTIQLFQDNGQILVAIGVDIHSSPKVRDAWQRESIDLMTATVIKQIEIQQNSGIIRNSIDATSVSRALILMNNGVLMDWMSSEPLADSDNILETLFLIWSSTLYEHLHDR